MTKKSKPVRLCVEGATTDGRKVQRQWLTDIERNYNTDVYGARINMEHWNYSWMPRFGDVTSVYTEEISDGPLAGKLALYGVLAPTPELVEMNKKRQKIYTSVEINPNFSDMGSAYLVGLAVTDNPASLGIISQKRIGGLTQNKISMPPPVRWVCELRLIMRLAGIKRCLTLV